MRHRSFSLRHFPGFLPISGTTQEGTITRRSTALSISFFLRGRLEEFAIAAPAPKPARLMGLWEETCFEFFLAPVNSTRYWEFNLSPAGHWNVYHFLDYRKGMKEEPAFASLPFRVEQAPDALSIFLEFASDRIVRPDQPLAVAVSAVLRQKDGKTIFWALTHAGSRPDFHCRVSFTLEL